MMLETLKEEDGGPERTVDMRRRLAADYPSVGFGWDFFLAYPGVEEQDAAHAAADLFATLEDRCKEASGSHYPAGVFLDQKKHREQLALLYGKSQAASGPQCPPGPKTGFHIFLSYRRTNASDARALKTLVRLRGCEKRAHQELMQIRDSLREDERLARPSPIPCALVSHAQGSSGVVENTPFAWRGHTKRLTTRARPSPDLAVWLE